MSSQGENMDHERIIEKVRKLLALSQSDNEHEAATAAAKAQELLAEYNLSLSDIPADDGRCMRATKSAARTRQRLEDWAYLLAGATSVAFDCRYVHFSSGKTVFIGVGADPEVCAWTYHYLYKTLLRMGSSYLRSSQCRRLRARHSKNAARASYLLGVVHFVSRRLKEQREHAPITEAALVPVKEDAIRAAMPSHQTKEYRPGAVRDGDVTNGLRDGRGISLSTPINSAGERQKIQ